MMDLCTYCQSCGAQLPDGPFAERRRFCNAVCYRRDYKAMEAKARIEAKRVRPPCEWCGGPVAPERKAGARYCGRKCLIAARNWRQQGRPRAKARKGRSCAICGGPIPETLQQGTKYCGDPCAKVAKRAKG